MCVRIRRGGALLYGIAFIVVFSIEVFCIASLSTERQPNLSRPVAGTRTVPKESTGSVFFLQSHSREQDNRIPDEEASIDREETLNYLLKCRLIDSTRRQHLSQRKKYRLSHQYRQLYVETVYSLGQRKLVFTDGALDKLR